MDGTMCLLLVPADIRDSDSECLRSVDSGSRAIRATATDTEEEMTDMAADEARCATHDLVAETWLIIAACHNRWGGAASTIIMPDVVRVEELNRLFHQSLASSNFDREFFILHLYNIVYGWSPGGWRLIAHPDSGAREQHQKQMADLVFNRIPPLPRR
jgi:hypothetical protein